MLGCSLHEFRSDALAPLLRHDEDALDVCGQAACCSGSWHAGDERDPGHANDLWPVEPGHERQVRVLVGGPPMREVGCECVKGPLCWLFMTGVQPQQPGQAGDVVRVGLADLHQVSLTTAWG